MPYRLHKPWKVILAMVKVSAQHQRSGSSMLRLDTCHPCAGIPGQLQQQTVVQDCRSAWAQDTVVDLTAERD